MLEHVSTVATKSSPLKLSWPSVGKVIAPSKRCPQSFDSELKKASWVVLSSAFKVAEVVKASRASDVINFIKLVDEVC